MNILLGKVTIYKNKEQSNSNNFNFPRKIAIHSISLTFIFVFKSYQLFSNVCLKGILYNFSRLTFSIGYDIFFFKLVEKSINNYINGKTIKTDIISWLRTEKTSRINHSPKDAVFYLIIKHGHVMLEEGFGMIIT